MRHWLDRATAALAPRWTLRRTRARLAAELLARHYEAAAAGRRTQGWNRHSGDANAAALTGIHRIREQARDLIRNNPYAASALDTIVDHAVGWGLVAAPSRSVGNARLRAQIAERWKGWADGPVCDADGRCDFAGLQKLIMRTVVESGEVLVRRRFRRPEDGLPVPLQLQVLEPDYLDTARDLIVTPNGGRIIQGIEFDAIGRRVAYWLFREHPGANLVGGRFGMSDRIPASEILHIFKPARAGQVRGVSWLAPVILRLRDFDEYEDAALMKQKIAACLAVVTSDVDGTAPALGTADDSGTPGVDSLEPGMVLNVSPGRQITVVQPPTIREHGEYAQTVLRAIAAGLGVTYEDLTGDYTEMPFSAARMSRLRHWARVDDWRWRMLIPQFCDPVWNWVMDAATIAGSVTETVPAVWTAPPMPMIEPDKEGLAYQRNIRSGIMTLSEAIRERGYDPEDLLAEMASDWKRLDALGLILDSDPRMTTQAGQPREAKPAAPAAPAVATMPEEERIALPARRRPRRQINSIRVAKGAFQANFQAPAAPSVNVDAPITVAPPSIAVAEGAVQAHVTLPPPPAVTVDARTHVEPTSVQIAEGAIQTRIEAPPAPNVKIVAPIHVEPAIVEIAEGAIQTHVEAPPPAAVRVEAPVHVAPPSVTIERGAIRTDVQVPTSRVTVERDAEGRAIGLVREAGPIQGESPEFQIERDERGRITRLTDLRFRIEDEPPPDDSA